jgi:hypothetical protein
MPMPTGSRLKPDNPGNARLLFIDGDNLACDICDEKNVTAVLDTIGGTHSSTIRICKLCIKEILDQFVEIK